MLWKRKYQYVPYEENDEVYFGCGKVVRAEWDYIYKRRASQAAAESEQASDTDEGTVSVILEGDGPGGFWISVIRGIRRAKRTKQTPTDTHLESGSNYTKHPPPPDLSGIALSGGGIRSASFCLGVLQALSYAGWLKKIDYMSTVSGGGYIGGALSWLLHRRWTGTRGEAVAFGLDRRSFPFGSYPMAGMERASEEENRANRAVYKGRMLRHLRQHARYLTPGDGINIMSLCAVVLRNTLFSLFVYGGLLVVLFALLWTYFSTSVAKAPGLDWNIWHLDWFPSNANLVQCMAIVLSIFLVSVAFFYVALTLLPRRTSSGYRLRYFYERWMGRMLTLAIIVALFGFVPVVHDKLGKLGDGKDGATMIKLSGHAGNLGEVSLTGELRRPDDTQFTESKSSIQDAKAGCGSNTADECAQSGETQGFSLWEWSKKNIPSLVGGLSTILGVIASLLALMQEGSSKKKKIPSGVLVAVASFGLIFGVLLLSYHFAEWLHLRLACWWPHGMDFLPVALQSFGAWAGMIILTYFIMRLPNFNYLSIHRYYRDRLMETFTPDLPDAINVNGPVPGASKSADSTRLYEMLNERGGAGELGPYHIINTNIVLVSSRIPKFRGRGGDNFILTPKYCGSNATGWCETRHSPYDDMTLPTAIAISGAAINSNAGVGGDGMTRTPWLSFLMGFFNLRLGYWADNPTPPRERLNRIKTALNRPLRLLPERNGESALSYTQRIVWHGLFVLCRWPYNQIYMLLQRVLTNPVCASPNKPNAFYPGLSEIFARTNLDENSRMVQLSDGGHFENLGLYELVRRRLKLIIVCDGTADPEYGFGDLANAMEKVRADFGAIIDLHCADMESLSPRDIIETGNENDKKVTYAKQGYLIGTIHYNDQSKGTLLFLTTTFFKELSADLYAYRKTYNEFPDQPTTDQFFDEKQFEAYRELGYQTAHKMMCDEKVRANDDVEKTLGTPQIRCPDKWRQS